MAWDNAIYKTTKQRRTYILHSTALSSEISERLTLSVPLCLKQNPLKEINYIQFINESNRNNDLLLLLPYLNVYFTLNDGNAESLILEIIFGFIAIIFRCKYNIPILASCAKNNTAYKSILLSITSASL